MRQLDNVLNSGELGSIFLGGTTPEDKVVTEKELQTATKAFYKFVEGSDTVADQEKPLATLDIAALEPGQYEIKYSLIGTYDGATVEIILENGTKTITVHEEPKSPSDSIVFNHIEPMSHSTGGLTLALKVKGEAGKSFVVSGFIIVDKKD